MPSFNLSYSFQKCFLLQSVYYYWFRCCSSYYMCLKIPHGLKKQCSPLWLGTMISGHKHLLYVLLLMFFCVNVLFHINIYEILFYSLWQWVINRVTLACPCCITVNEAPSTQHSALSLPRINKRFWSWMQLFTSNNSSLSKSCGYSEKGQCAIHPYLKNIGGYTSGRQWINCIFWGLERNQTTRMRLEAF